MRSQVGTHFFLTFILLFTAKITAQNLVPNPSFEENTSCPSSFGAEGLMDCEPWFNANDATADYYNACSVVWVCDVPDNYPGSQVPHSGVAYTGILVKFQFNPPHWFEYIENQLSTPLEFGRGYYVSFYVSLPSKFCAISQIGAYFSVGPVNQPSSGFLPFTPQVESNSGFLNDTLNWMLIEGCFVAQGGEDHIIIGNFHSYEDTPLEVCTAQFNFGSYYYIDDVSVEEIPLTGIDVDLGDDVTVCYEYTIVPDVSEDVQYLWSDGSTGSELTVTTSGLYKLTVYDDQCRGGKDSIEVTITDKPPVALNPDDTLICSNEPFVISLNPNAGDYEWNDGSTSPQYTISTPGNYSVTLNDGCDLTEDEIEVEVMEPPADFILGNDTVLCQGTEFEINFDPALGDFTWQDGSQTNYMIIFQEGTYALTISNMCGDASASVEVEALIPVNVNIGPAQEVLCNNETLDIFLDPTYATYQWQDGSTNFEYHITTAGTYTVTMTHLCGASSDSIVILQLPIPNVDIGDSILVCPGDSVFLTTSGIIGNYTWQDGSTNDSILVTSSNVYALTIDNACGTDQDSVMVQFGDLLTPVSFGADMNLCPGEHLTLQAGNAGATHLWQDGSNADTLLVNAAGDYHVIVSNACFTFSDTIHVDAGNNPPVIDFLAQILLCQGNTATLDPGVTGVNYLWNDGTIDPTLSVSNPGAYSLTVSNACGADVDTIQVIDGGPLPAVELGINISLCPGDTVLVEPDFLHVDSWTWQDGSSSSSFSVTDAGMVSIDVANGCGVATDTLLVSWLDPAPVLDLGADTSLCNGETVTLSITTPGIDILWNDGSIDSTLLVQLPGQYSATVSNSCGIDTDTFQLSLLPAIPTLDLGPDLPLCPGETFTLVPGIDNVDYVWQDGSTDTLYMVNSAQTVVLNISNSCGASLDSLSIFTSTNGPDVELGSDILACEGESVTINANISGVNYVWQDGSTGSSLMANTSGWYAVTVSNSCGMDMDTVIVDIHGTPPEPDLGTDTLLCEGKSLTLVSNADGETTSTWQDGSGLSSFVVNAPGTYSLQQQNRCGEKLDSIIVMYQPLPEPFDLGPDTTLCPGESLLLTGPVTLYTYQWQDGSHAPTFLADQAGYHSLSISNLCGARSDSMFLQYDERLPEFPAEDAFILCPGDSVALDVSQMFPVTYTWSTNSASPSITVITPGVYSVSIITDCVELSGDFTIEVKTDCLSTNEIFIPNIFSPNGDQVNDEFGLFPNVDMDILSIEGSIFDRWGNLVFESSRIPYIWNGKFGDEEMMPGVYVYSLVVKFEVNGQVIQERFTGDVTLVK